MNKNGKDFFFHLYWFSPFWTRVRVLLGHPSIYILYKLTARPTYSIVSHIFSKTLFSLWFSLSFAVHIFLIVYLSLFFLSLYAMELINGTISPHQEELLGFLSRYDAVRSDNYLSYIQNIVWFWPGFFGRYRLGCKPKGVYKTKQLVEEFEGLSNGTHAGFSGVLKCTQVRNHQGRRQLKARDLIFFFFFCIYNNLKFFIYLPFK